MTWHLCGTESVQEGSKGANSWPGKWFTGNVKACKGAPGETEGLLSYSGTKFVGMENHCSIKKITRRGAGFDLLLRCAAEGEEYDYKEYIEMSDGKLSRTTLLDGKRQTYLYSRCP
ncbi:hypothetical protein V1283_003315 [Bradyrhizobium sp. AZCC 2262]